MNAVALGGIRRSRLRFGDVLRVGSLGLRTRPLRTALSTVGVAIGIAAIWTLLKLLGPLISGIASALASQRKRAANEALDITEQDIPVGLVGIISAVTLVAIGVLLWTFTLGTPLAASAPSTCASTYPGTSRHPNRPATANATVTAGFKWAPLRAAVL